MEQQWKRREGQREKCFVMGVCTRNWLFSDESLSSLSCSIRIVLCQVDRWEAVKSCSGD